MTKVALLRCDSYTLPVLKERIGQAMTLIGFEPSIFNGAKVALKPNLLSAVSGNSAVVTHPLFFRAASEIVLENGGRPILIESPAVASLDNALDKTGYRTIVQDLAIEVASSGRVKSLSFPEGRVFRHFEVAGELLDADFVLNMPKFKTHNLTYVTGAVKNLFGFVPGMRKSQMHMRFPDNDEFSEQLLDLYGAVVYVMGRAPVGILHVMDAVVALEGQGPGSAGTPRKMGAMLMGKDGVALDYVATRVAGLDVRRVETITRGFDRGFSVSGPGEIEVVGESIDHLKIAGFVPADSTGGAHLLRRLAASKAVRDLFIARPEPEEDRCILCYECMNICPAGAIGHAGPGTKVPVFDYRKCIRCFCCSEICPEAAICLRRGKLQWMLRL
ncbi:MAG: DUF362 domain-containing protein [Deltaproteobacteria bacterium]|nr:DUF362 domain-containing protein [Deltaproteobacteria bacterium]